MEYRFLVEATKIENASFPFKTALSEANVKTNKMATTKWTYHKEWSFASNCLIFLENLFQFENLLKRVNFHIHIFCKHQSFILGCIFLVSILNQLVLISSDVENSSTLNNCLANTQPITSYYVKNLSGNQCLFYLIKTLLLIEI